MPSMFHVLSLVVGAFRLVVGLLAGFGAADVDAVDDDAGNRLEHDPRVARGSGYSEARRAMTLVATVVLLGVDDRALGGDFDRARHAADAQCDRQWNARSGRDRNLFVFIVGKPRELRRYDVRAGSQVQHMNLTPCIADTDRSLRSCRFDGRAGQDCARTIGDRDVDASREHLRCRRYGPQRHTGRRQRDDQSSPHENPSILERTRRPPPPKRPAVRVVTRMPKARAISARRTTGSDYKDLQIITMQGPGREGVRMVEGAAECVRGRRRGGITWRSGRRYRPARRAVWTSPVPLSPLHPEHISRREIAEPRD